MGLFLASLKIPDDGEVGLMGGQAKHDEVSISSTENMLGVRVVVGRGSLLPGNRDKKCHEVIFCRLINIKYFSR